MADIGHVFLTKAWVFQAVLAGPTFVLLGMCAVFGLYGDVSFTIYDFITDLCTSILAAAIIFLVLAQRRLPAVGKAWTFRFELAKSGLATALWLWLMADSIWGPSRYYYYHRRRRIIAGAIASILLFLFFYPTVFYTHYVLRTEREMGERDLDEAEREQGDDERAPLLATASV